jgi:hypothetical protein
MVKYNQMVQFAKLLFDQKEVASQAARILCAFLDARSARLSEVARKMSGNPEAKYKALQRFLRRVDVKAVLWRLFQAEAPFVIGDVTEIERPQARRTEYVGRLKDGKTRGFWVLVLATPFRGRAIPFHFLTYSSRTIQQEATSRNLYHFRALQGLKALIGEKPLVFDREFSYLEFLLHLVAKGMHFVIRLNLSHQAPIFTDSAGKPVELVVSPGEKVVQQGVWYKGQVRVNVVGCWERRFGEPLWVMTDLNPEQALPIYLERMNLEEGFRDMKTLLGMGKVMNKSQRNMEQVLALLMLAYAIALLVGEKLRDRLFCGAEGQQKRQQYSGLFLLLQKPVKFSTHELALALLDALGTFRNLVLCLVPTHV